MTALATALPRASAFSAVGFEAFRVMPDPSQTYAIRLAPPPRSLAEAVAAALSAQVFYRKDMLIVREANALTGKVTLHLYVIREGAPKWVHPAGEPRPVRVTERYADQVAMVDGNVLAGTTESNADPCPYCGSKARCGCDDYFSTDPEEAGAA